MCVLMGFMASRVINKQYSQMCFVIKRILYHKWEGFLDVDSDPTPRNLNLDYSRMSLVVCTTSVRPK